MTDPLLAAENDYRSLLGNEVAEPDLRVGVVIPVFNRTGLLQRTIAGLTRQTYPEQLLAVFVADDGSTEDVAGAIAELGVDLDITVVRREHEGYGAGQARNLGAEAAAAADVLVFFDADCIPDEDAVTRHAIWHHLADNLVVIGSRHHIDTAEVSPELIREGAGLRRLAFGTDVPDLDSWESEDHRKILHRRTASLRRGDMAFRSLVSSNFSIRRDRFIGHGGFSGDFTRWGGEDTELGWRLWNDGAFFIDDPLAAIYHQTQEDAGAVGWRERSREANDGLIQSKIPHRHYRKSSRNIINERPKVSVLVHQPDARRLEELANQVLSQRLDDTEMIIADPGGVASPFIERRLADPRFGRASSVEKALRESSGEFVAVVHGSVGLDHRLLSRSVSTIEAKSSVGWIWSAYAIPTNEGLDVYRRHADVSSLDEMWGETLPLFGLTRRRELMKCAQVGMGVAEAWGWVTEELESTAHGVPLVIVPATTPAGDHPVSVTPPTSLRSEVIADLKTGGGDALKAPIRAAATLLTGRPYRPTPVEPGGPSPAPSDRPVSIRYVGWTGRSNLGDEAMLKAIRDLHPWANIEPSGDMADVLMLGGGTLINRGYLRHLRPLDSPRVERVAFGPGVANPEYWGDPKERPSDWVDFLESCLLVGVRGPISASILDDWGLRRSVEIIGDPALSLTATEGIEKVAGRVVLCPAWTRGLLWGESDDDVIDAFARLTGSLRMQGHEVWALSAFPADDRYIIEMMRRAGTADLPYLAAHEDPQPALDLLASAEVVVSERLHGAVLAAAAGTVPVMVEYRPKLRDFAESVDLGDFVIRTDSLDGRALEELTNEALETRSELSERMQARVLEFRSKQRAAAETLKIALGP